MLANSFWIPFARLSYGAYLSHSIFMIFRGFNSERGTWGSEMDAILFYMAYFTLAFVFSLAITLTVETPLIRMYKEFFGKSKNFAIKEAAALKGSSEDLDNNLTESLDVST